MVKIKNPEIQNFIEENQGKHFCHCLCNGIIIIKERYYYYGIPKYVLGHSNRVIKKKKTIEIDKWVEENQGKHFCACPRHEVIIIRREYHCCGIPKYIKNHENIGRKFSEERRNNISKSLKGVQCSEEKKQILSVSVSNAIKGENNPNWRGGTSFEPYCEKFNELLKENIRERDNHQCQYPECLCTQLESLVIYGCKLNVHHIHYDKENCYPDLITLCRTCNTKANGNREYWEQLYMDILKKRGLLNYFGNNK